MTLRCQPADDLGGEGNGLAVIGGLTPEVVGVLDFPLELGVSAD